MVSMRTGKPGDDWPIGLSQDPLSGDWRFIMPTASSVTTATVFEVLQDILKVREKLPEPGLTVKFASYTATRNALGAVIELAVSEIFDTALADTLHLVGETSLEAALEELTDASNEPTLDGKRRHRLLAQGHLGHAYKASEKEISFLERKMLPHTQRLAVQYCRAARIAAMISLINKDAGLLAARRWADTAKSRFDRYESVVGRPDPRSLRSMRRKLVRMEEGLWSWSPFAVHPLETGGAVSAFSPRGSLRSRAVRDLGLEVRAHEKRIAARAGFDALYQALISPAPVEG